MSVLVEDAAEAVVSAYGKAGDSLGFEQVGERVERRGRLERSVGAVLVVMELVGA
ncbi:hypothetical protein ACFVZD_35935 [Streptomyces sp. NPDC058287]|uniref:hypothetical protein n=1 Tax=unclassified Streptomyces TaxID=2593676 RepID=UPI0036E5C9B8